MSADNHEHTMTLSEAAIGQLKALQLPAVPRNYEIFYAHAEGNCPSLEQIIDKAMIRNGTVLDTDLDGIGGRFVSPSAIADQVDTVGWRLHEKIEQIAEAMDSSTDTTSACAADLERTIEALGTVRKPDSLADIVADVMRSIIEITANTSTLKAHLSAANAEIESLRSSLEAICQESQRDPLTGLVNRQSFDPLLRKTMVEAEERGESMSLIACDIDKFAAFNGTWGHQAGDNILRLVASSLRRAFNGRSVIGRFGGDQFVIALANTALEPARAVADEFRLTLMSKDILNRSGSQKMGRATMSFGIASGSASDTVASLIERANACLAAAKRLGRNRVVCETDEETVSVSSETVAA